MRKTITLITFILLVFSSAFMAQTKFWVYTDAGKKLKTTSGWYSNGNGTDTYGFAALPAGYADGSSVYGVGYGTGFWTATPYEDYSYIACYRSLDYSYDYLVSGGSNKYYGRSVRCLRN